jgi:hypothetical protein
VLRYPAVDRSRPETEGIVTMPKKLKGRKMEIYNTYDDRSPGDKMVDFGIGFICFVIFPAIAIVLVSGLIYLLT